MNVQIGKTEERNEKYHRQGSEGISSKHTRRYCGLSENRTLKMKVKEDEGTKVER
jgi:hypothetical protein